MKTPFSIYALTGFMLAAVFAVAGDWTLQEFCWSTWAAGLTYVAVSVVTGAFHTIIASMSLKSRTEEHIKRLCNGLLK